MGISTVSSSTRTPYLLSSSAVKPRVGANVSRSSGISRTTEYNSLYSQARDTLAAPVPATIIAAGNGDELTTPDTNDVVAHLKAEGGTLGHHPAVMTVPLDQAHGLIRHLHGEHVHRGIGVVTGSILLPLQI